MDIEDVVGRLDGQLQARGSADRAVQEKRYLKSDGQFYGVSVPGIARVAKQFVRSYPTLGRDELVALVTTLWAPPIHERRRLAVELLMLHQALLLPDDVSLLERLLRESGTWALVDELAARVAPPVLERHPIGDAVIERWASDDDFWIRRSALLVHLLPLRSGGGDFARFGRLADAMLEEKEFFIRKAIGWVLRDTARLRPDLVHAWIAPRARRASGVTIREAIKRLAPDQAAQVLADHRDHRRRAS